MKEQFLRFFKFVTIFRGRISRSQFIKYVLLIQVIIPLLLFAPFIFLVIWNDTILEKNFVQAFFMLLGGGYVIFMIYSSIILIIRRIKDFGNDNYWLLVPLLFLPPLNFIVFFFLVFKKGSQGDNKYGIDPTTSTIEDLIKISSPRNITKQKEQFHCYQCNIACDKNIYSCTQCGEVFWDSKKAYEVFLKKK